MFSKTTQTLGIALLLGGCGAVPQRDVMSISPKTPAHWAADNAISTKQATQWLAIFADPALSQWVNVALVANYDLKAAATRVEIARQQARIAGAGRLPQLGFSTDYQRGNLSNSSENSAYALFNFSWELDVWGRIKASQQAAQQDATAARADFYGARLSLAARTAQSYFDLLEANLQVEVSEQSIKDRRIIVELVRGRFQRGLTGGLDVRLVLTDLENAKAQLASAQNQVQQITRRLEVLLGQYPGGNLKHTADLPNPPPMISAGLPSELLTRRPDVIAAFERLKATDSRLASAKKALLPRITLTANGGADLLDPRAAAWNLAMGLVQPIFTGGRLTAEIRLNQARSQEALHNYQSVTLNAFREVEQALAAEQWLYQQEQALKQAVEQTQASRELAVYSYRQGLIQILTLLDSYRSTLTAQSQYLAVRRQLLNNRIDLYLALGGGI